MAKVLIGGNSKIRSITADSTLCFFVTIGATVLPLATLPPFDVEIYVENRESEKVECSFDGTTKTNLTIEDNGEVTCYIPSNSFSVGGRLYMRLTTYNPNENFADGTCDDVVIVDTDYRIE